MKKLSLIGNFDLVFQLLRRLDHPETMDEMTLNVSSCTVGKISVILGQYAQDYTRRDGRFRGGFEIDAASFIDRAPTWASTISSTTMPVHKVMFATLTAIHREDLSISSKVDELCINLVAHTPGAHVVYFGRASIDSTKRTVAAMPKIQELRLINTMLDHRFLRCKETLNEIFKSEASENGKSSRGVVCLDDGCEWRLQRRTRDTVAGHTLFVTALSSLTLAGSTPTIVDSFKT
jgi:hypothetical protein